MSTGKCPKCNKIISKVKVDTITIESPARKGMQGLSYRCVSCSTVVSVSFDPIELQKVLNQIRA